MKKNLKPLKIILIASFFLTFIFAGIILFSPIGYPTIKSAIGDFGLFDFRFSYTADNVMTVLSHYKGDRISEMTRFYTMDFVFAFFCGIFTFCLPLLIYFNDSKHYLLFRSAAFSSIMIFIFNVIENILLLRIINITPVFTEGEADIASGVTSLKWIFAALWIASVVFLILGTLFFGTKVKKTKKHAK